MSKKVASSLSFYVIATGWMGAFIYTLILFDSFTIEEFLSHFLSAEHNGIRFRALFFFAPLIATVLGYMVHEREKHLMNLKQTEYELAATNRHLEAMIEQKDQFLIRLGHDLKTPLTPLVTLLPLIKKRETDPKNMELLDAATTNVDILKELIIKSLKLARVKAPRELNLETIDLSEKLSICIAKRESLYMEKQINILNKVKSGIAIRADRVDLEELFYNLISNAIKYSPPAMDIVIDAQNKDDLIYVSVSDQGKGLTVEQAEHIFDAFYKVDESRHDLDSSGLGLSICKNIVTSHGGTIWARSKGLGKGTTINFSMPSASGSPEDYSGN